MPDWMTWDLLADIRQWATFVFAGVAAWIAWAKLRDERGAKRSATAKHWSLTVKAERGIDGSLVAELRLELPDDNRFFLHSVRSRVPGGAVLALAARHGDPNKGRRFAPSGPYAPTLVIAEPMDPVVSIGGGIRTMDYSLVRFLCRPSAKCPERIVIEVNAEEISANRTRSRFIIKSQPIICSNSSKAIKK